MAGFRPRPYVQIQALQLEDGQRRVPLSALGRSLGLSIDVRGKPCRREISL